MPLPVDERAHHTKFEQDKIDVCTRSLWASKQKHDSEASSI